MPLGVEPSQQISIHALREEGDLTQQGAHLIDALISIHALREEGDLADATSCKVSCEISIHALREEGDARMISP